MQSALINLNRSLFEQTGTDWSESNSRLARAQGKLLTWPDVLANRYSVLVGSANSGKTSEFQLQAKTIREAGGHACFISVRELLVAGAIEDALETPEAVALRAWLKATNRPLHLFVDSIDEAALSGPRDLRNCLRKLVDKVAKGAEHVTWLLSTRPIALNVEVLVAIEDALGVKLSRLTSTDVESSGIASAARGKVQSQQTEEPSGAAKVFRLAPFTEDQTQTFLEVVVGLADAPASMDAAQSHGLGHLLLTPGKCKFLAQLNLVETPPKSLEEIYRRSLDLHLSAPTHGRSQKVKTPRSQLEEEASRLASACTLCERLNIELPAEADTPSPQALAARALVPGLLDSELQYLLSIDIFEESGHQQVKIEPDDMRFYLTARRLSELIQGREDALKVAQVLGWRAPSGEVGIFAPFIPVAGWLATLSPYFRTECLELDPQCVAFFGDLRHMPLGDAKTALTAATRQVAGGQRPGRGMYMLTSENYWQAGGPHVLPHIAELFKENLDNEDARELLLEVAGTVKSPVLRKSAFDWAGKSYERILEDIDLLDYFLAAGTASDAQQLAKVALKNPSLPEAVTRRLLRHGAWKTLKAADIAALIRPALDSDERKYSLSYSLEKEVAPKASTEQLQSLTALLFDLMTRTAAENNGEEDEDGDPVKWLAEVVAELLAQLAQRSMKGPALKALAVEIARFQHHALGKSFSPDIDAKSLQNALAAPSVLRTAVLRELLRLHKESDQAELWRNFMGGRGVVSPSIKEAKAHKAKLLEEMLQGHADAIERGKKQTKETPAKKGIRANEKNRSELTKRIAAIRKGNDVNALSWVAQLISASSGVSRYGEVGLKDFAAAYGAQLAVAVDTGLKALWRKEAPRRDEDNSNSTYWSTIAGLQGLHLEFSDSPQPAATKAELRRALDYGLYELNGLPRWYWPMSLVNSNESLKFFRDTLKASSKGAVSSAHAHKLLNHLEDAPPAIQKSLAKDAWAAVCRSDMDRYLTDNILSVLVEKKLVPPEEFADEAQRRTFSQPGSATAAVWALNWMLLDAPTFLSRFEEARSQKAAELDSLISGVATALEDGRGPSFQQLARESSAVIDALKSLYLELRRVLPPEQDEPRLPGKVYSVDERERAQRTRDRIPGMLVSSQTTAGYRALGELRELNSDPRARAYFSSLMRQTAEAMQRRTRPMTESDFLEFEQTLRQPPGSLDAFAQRVENDLLDVRDIVEKGEFSPRRFLATSVQDVEAGVVKAMEDEFQLYLAGQLAILGRNHYSVFREPQGSDDTRRDISIAFPARDWKTTMELKVTLGGWTVQEYRDSLRNQLVGYYMRERNTTVGFLVILRQTRREWDGPSGSVDYEGLLKILREDASAIEAEQPLLRLRVVGIDATEPLTVDGEFVRTKSEPKSVKAAKKTAKNVRRARPTARV